MIPKIKPGADSRRNWKTINQICDSISTIRTQNSERRGAIAGLRQRPRDVLPGLPFQIYQSSTWLNFKVTTGRVITTSGLMVPDLVETEFTLSPDVLRSWFYLDSTDPADPFVAVANPMPTWGAGIIPIGWVDTKTLLEAETPIITQHYPFGAYLPCS